VIATDADVDGMHIAVIDYFFSTIFSWVDKRWTFVYFTNTTFQSTKQERNYLLLFWWRTKSSNRKLKPKPEITRFKGLGEISPDELKILLEKLFGWPSYDG
jgi:topoisomerase-4 subunit B